MQVKIVRRRAHARRDGVQVLVRPGFRAAPVDRDRKVLVQPHAQTQFHRAPAHGLELQLGLPLQILIELDPFGVRLGIACNLGRRGIAVGFRPDGPAPDLRIIAVKMLLQRFKQGVAPKRWRMRGLVGTEGLRARCIEREMVIAKMRETEFEYRQLDLGDAGVVHQIGAAQCFQA